MLKAFQKCTFFITLIVLCFSARGMDASSAHTSLDKSPFANVKLKEVFPKETATANEIASQMKQAFLIAYTKFPPKELKISFTTKEEWLEATFTDLAKDFQSQTLYQPIHLFLALMPTEKSGNSTALGAIFLEPDRETPNRLHIMQMALFTTPHEGLGTHIATELRAYLLHKYPQTTSAVANVRHLNLPGQKFVESLGFKRVDKPFHGYSPESYAGYSLEISTEEIKKK